MTGWRHVKGISCVMLLFACLNTVHVRAQDSEFAPEVVSRPRLSPSVKNSEYPVPLRFEVAGDGVEVLPLKLDYDLESSAGKQLSFGGRVHINGLNFYALVAPMSRLDRDMQRQLPQDANRNWVFILRFPELLFKQAELEILSRDGRVLWSRSLNEKNISQWERTKQRWAKDHLPTNLLENQRYQQKPLFQAQFGVQRLDREMAFLWSLEDWIKICISEISDTGITRLCSGQYEVARTRQGLQLRPLILSEQPAKVFINGEAAPLRLSEDVKIRERLTFFSELSTGISMEFSTLPQPFALTEIVDQGNGKATLMAEGAYPLQKHEIQTQERVSAFESFIGWEPTIGDFREYWQTEIAIEDPVVMLAGQGGGIFKQEFTITRLPKEEHRPYLYKRTPYGTYVDGIKLFGRKQKSLAVNTKQNQVSVDKDNPELFTWRFGAKDSARYNRSYITVEDGQNKYNAYFELYKAYQRELSLRLSGAYATGGALILLGEGAFNYWFEDIFGWSNYYLSRQRWGVSAKAFSSVNSFEFSGFTSNLLTNTFDLKYRLRPGLWGRDESLGLMLSSQAMSYDIFRADMVGAGAFWARSMPRVFDDALNVFSFMRYPKWVDLEFIYYPMILNPENKVRNLGNGTGNWALNFHGKLMWTQRFFGEAGFGIKNLDFNREGLNDQGLFTRLRYNFTSFYTTVGIGLNF